MTTDPDALFAEDEQPEETLTVEHPDFRVRVQDHPIPMKSSDLADPEALSPEQLLHTYVDLQRIADNLSVAATEAAKGAQMYEPYVRKVIDARKGMAIPAFIGVTPYNIAIESKTALKLEGDKEDIIAALNAMKGERWEGAVKTEPAYNTSNVLKRCRDELKAHGLPKPEHYTVEAVAQALPPEIGKYVQIETTKPLTFREQK